MYKERNWDYQIWDILLTKIDNDGACIDDNIYSYEGECSGKSDDINCSNDIVKIDKGSATRLIEMLKKQIKEL